MNRRRLRLITSLFAFTAALALYSSPLSADGPPCEVCLFQCPVTKWDEEFICEYVCGITIEDPMNFCDPGHGCPVERPNFFVCMDEPAT
jgi:hypothetical protein